MAEQLRALDANLLVVLQALLEQRNLTRASELLSMSRPSVSAALKKLRVHFGDDLLVATRRGLEPTPVGAALLEPVRAAVTAAEALLGGRSFDPGTAEVRFSAAMSDYAMALMGGPLVGLLNDRAPGCTLHIDLLRSSRAELDRQLLRHDFLVGPLDFGLPGRQQAVFADELVCVTAAGNPWLDAGSLSAQALSEMPHAVVHLSWQDPGAFALDTALDLVGVTERTEVVRVDRLLDLPHAVAGSDRCAFMPSWLAGRFAPTLDLIVAETPVERVPIIEATHWNPSRQDDPAVAWLGQLVEDAGSRILADMSG